MLQELGLKEYEAKCFVALSRLPRGTAKDISEVSDVPRTRVYDAARVLESKGLVEVQHTKPQEFRAVDIEEATATLEGEYRERMTKLEDALEEMTPVQTEDSTGRDHEVWTLSDSTAISNRLCQLVRESTDDVLLVISESQTLSDDLQEALQEAIDAGLTVSVGTDTETRRETIAETLPGADVFVVTSNWLGAADDLEEPRLTHIALLDRDTILVGSAYKTGQDEHRAHATLGTGFNSGIVAIVRRLLTDTLSED
jgi:sugar-specific transcriptional regulator TrmB